MALLLFWADAGHAGINVGDIIFQLVAFIILLAIPLTFLIVFVKIKKRNSRLSRIEEKLDQLLDEKEHKNNGK